MAWCKRLAVSLAEDVGGTWKGVALLALLVAECYLLGWACGWYV